MNENTNDPDKHSEVINPDDGDRETPEVPGVESSSEASTNASDTTTPNNSSPEIPSEGGSDESGGPSSSPPETSSSSEAETEKPELSQPSSGSDTPVEASTTNTAPSTQAKSSETVPAPPAVPSLSTLGTTPPAAATVNTSAAPTLPADDAPTPTKKPSRILTVVAVVVILALAVIIGAMIMGNKNSPAINTSKNNNAVNSKLGPKINTWTGKGNTYDWDTAANWSLGVPTNGESLMFDVAAVKQPSGGSVTFQDNIPSLRISKLIVNGVGAGFTIAGSPLTLTNGIVLNITHARATTTPSAVQIDNALTFTGNQSVKTAANNSLTLSGVNGAITTLGSSNVQFVAAKSGAIEVSTPLVGTGEVEAPSSTTTTGNVDFNTASPNFTGNVLVNSGATIGMGNQNAAGTGISTTDAFGTAVITIASGGYLELNEIDSSSFTIPNDITVAGNGGTSTSQVNGTYTGAISSCITSTQQGCGSGATVTFTGKLTIVANTEFGSFYGLNAPQAPTSTTVTYIVENLTTNNHTLTAVPDSKAVVQLPK